jgi:predicted Fe-S protein YdhL (DUF1289 family)
MRQSDALVDRQERPPSPCINVCALDAQGYCSGCLRTGTEIGQWISMSPAQQWRLIAELQQRRKVRGF